MSHIKIRNPGEYDQFVTVERVKSAPTTDDYGVVDLTDSSNWETYVQRWAKVSPRTGLEYTDANQTKAVATDHVFMQSDELTRAITTQMRISHNSTTLEIIDAKDSEHYRAEVQLICLQGK